VFSENVRIIDIDPWQWRRLYEIFFPEREKESIYIVHDKGRVIKAVNSKGDLIKVGDLSHPSGEAKELQKLYQVDYVIILEKRVAKNYFIEIQKGYDFREDMDEYIVKMWQLLSSKVYEGNIVIYSGKGRKLIYEIYKKLRNFVEEKVPHKSTLVLCVFEDSNSFWVSLIIGVENKKISLITTTDSLVSSGLRIQSWKQDYIQILNLVEKKFYKPYLGLFMDKKIFFEFLETKDKWDYLRRALRKKEIIGDPLPT